MGTRRLIALGAAVVVIILIVVLINGCLDSRKKQSLRTYAENVASLTQLSDEQGHRLFDLLNGAGSRSSEVQDQVNQVRISADDLLDRARHLDVPGDVKEAQQNFVTALKLRRIGIALIAQQLEPALGRTVARDAVNKIAADMQMFVASNVLLTVRTNPLVAQGLAKNGITDESFARTNFLPDLGWLDPNTVATRLGASLPGNSGGTGGRPAPGTHGHQLDSVSVGSNTLQTGVANHVAASPTPIFTVKFTNGGENNETNVQVKIRISRAGLKPIDVVKTVATTTAGEQSTVDIPLATTPPRGAPVTVSVTVVPVPGEKDSTNNTESYTVLFT